MQDPVGGLLHGVDGGAELAGRARHPPLLAVGQQRGEFARVAGEGVAQMRELALERRELAAGMMRMLRCRMRRRRRAAFTGHLLDAEEFLLHDTAPDTDPDGDVIKHGH